MSKTLLISRVFPPEVGGNGRWMWEIYSRLPRDECVIAAGEYPGCREFDMTHDLSIVRLPLHLDSWGAFGWRRGAAYYGLHSALYRIIREHGIEQVHASNCLPEGFLAWTLSRRYKLPYLLFAHGEELAIAATSRELEWMARRAYAGAQTVIANSRNTARMLIDRWNVPAKSVRVIHPGIDTSEYQPVPLDPSVRRQFGWHNRRVILTVGRLMKRKGHETIIRALPQISRSIPDVLYAIVGDGDERAALEQLARGLELNDRVMFHGELDNELVKRAHQQCDLFAMANREVGDEVEGFGIVLLEAQACGKPVIAGDSGGTIEAVNAPHSGRIVRPDCPDELARTIVELLLDKALCEQMGRLGREWVEKHFDWDVLAPEVSSAFCRNASGIAERHTSSVAAIASR